MLKNRCRSNKVLILDDEKKIITLIKRVIDWNSLNCIIIGEAYNGIDGLELIRTEKPDIVISDVKMPGLDGITLMRQIKDEIPNLYFIFISGYGEFEYAQSALNMGALGYVLKPLDGQQLAELLMKGIEKLRQNEENRTLKVIANNGIEEYLDTVDSYVANEFYNCFNSEIEDRMIISIRQNELKDSLSIIDDIFLKAEKSVLDFISLRKLAFEICRSFLKHFHTELFQTKSEINYMEYFKKCSGKEDIKRALKEYIIVVIDRLKLYRNQSSPSVIEKVKCYINENIEKELSLQNMAQLVYMNPTYFSELFKKETGENFVEYVTRCRLNLAKGLLADGSMKMEEIAARTGYGRLEYFYKVFKKYEGITPKEFRKLKL
jgi:Response regulator containing CheY-like receiver domain and AraC-type DNA-binding domain